MLELGDVGVHLSGSPQDDHRAGKSVQRCEMARTLIVFVVPNVFQELPIEALDATWRHIAARAAEVANRPAEDACHAEPARHVEDENRIRVLQPEG